MHTTDDLLQEIAKLRAEVRELRAAVNNSPPAPASDPAPTPTNRRQLLTLAAAGVGGAGYYR